MNRRRLLWSVAALFLAAPLAALAQGPPASHRVAYLISDGVLSNACEGGLPGGSFHSFREGLRVLGYVQERNVEFVCRSAEGRYERLDALTDELLRTRPSVIVGGGWRRGASSAHPASRSPATTTASGSPRLMAPPYTPWRSTQPMAA